MESAREELLAGAALTEEQHRRRGGSRLPDDVERRAQRGALADDGLLGPGEALLGVLDLDSPVLDRFDIEDEKGLEALAAILAEKLTR